MEGSQVSKITIPHVHPDILKRMFTKYELAEALAEAVEDLRKLREQIAKDYAIHTCLVNFCEKNLVSIQPWENCDRFDEGHCHKGCMDDTCATIIKLNLLLVNLAENGG